MSTVTSLSDLRLSLGKRSKVKFQTTSNSESSFFIAFNLDKHATVCMGTFLSDIGLQVSVQRPTFWSTSIGILFVFASNTAVSSSYYAEAYFGIVLYLFCLVFFSFFSSSSFSFFFSFSRFFSQLYLKNYKAPEVETLYTDSP